MTTLLHGGYICILSESGKRDSLAKTIEGMQVNCAKLTLIVARLIHYHIVLSLRKLILGAELVSLEDS
jgi:hypothetical protein